MKHEFNPTHLDILTFARAQQSLSGELGSDQLSRLAQDTAGDNSQLKVTWQAQGGIVKKNAAADEVWLNLEAQGQVDLRCQRCMQPFLTTLLVDRTYRFVRDEETAWQEDEESEEDLLVLSRDFDLLELIEDELIMDLPLVPMHDHCESEWTPTSEDEKILTEDKPHPFAVLKSLKINKLDK
jgi:uncharacterized protein